jgi:amino-acid N-acetyltransferase
MTIETRETFPETDQRLVAWIRQAAPYIHAFRGRSFVIAFGGEMLAEGEAQALIHDVALLDAIGIRLVLVHGNRPQIDAEMHSRGLEPRFHRDMRVTDADAMECVKRAMGVSRFDIQALLSQGLPNTPLAGGFLRVTGGNFITARPVGVIDGVDFGYTGTVRKVIAEEIRDDLAQENVVLITPLGYSPTGETFNLAWEDVASAVAIAIKAEKLIYLCDGPGLINRLGQAIDALTVDEAQKFIDRKIEQPSEVARVLPNAISACRGGVGRVHILDRKADGAMLMEFFTRDGVGTVITEESLAKLRDATIDDVGAIVTLIEPLEADGTLVKRSRERLEMEINRFAVVEYDGIIVGCAALYPVAETKAERSGDGRAAEMACLAVMPDFRRSGIGDQLRGFIESKARKAKFSRLFVLTTRTAHWFIERGFIEVPLDNLPAKRRDLYNYQRRSKVLMQKL